MQTVSQEWNDNQRADVRKPGFVVIDIQKARIPYGEISYSVEQDGEYTKYTTEKIDRLEYYKRCLIKLNYNRDALVLGDYARLKTYNSENEVIIDKAATPSLLSSSCYFDLAMPTFSYMEILCTKDALTSIEVFVDGIPSTDISTIEHPRSYDPMGFELPTNSISIDVLNYDGKYTDFYKRYANNPYAIEVKYGYTLESGDEIIPGGSFTMTDVQLNDNVLTITGDSFTSQIDGKLTADIFDLKGNGGYIRIPVSDDASVETVNLAEREELSISVGDILSYLRDTAELPIDYQADSNYLTRFIVNTAINASYVELLQAVISFTLTKTTIGRDDAWTITNGLNTIADGNHILMTNCFEKPSYSSTKKVKSFEIADCTLGASQSIEESTHGDDDTGDSTGSVKLDTLSNKLLCADVSWYSNIDGIYYLDIYPDRVEVHYRHNAHEEWEKGMRVDYASFSEGTIVTQVDNNGAICDINSPLGTPIDCDKIVKYFSNRDLYTFKVRGNPARDVGDYVWVSLTDDADETTYKKGLVLSSTLTYDGSFKEEVTVRIIETEFEGETEDGNNS